MNQPKQSLMSQTFTQNMSSPNLKTNGDDIPRPSSSQSRKSTLKFPVFFKDTNNLHQILKRTTTFRQFPMKPHESSKENGHNKENKPLSKEMPNFSKTTENPILKERLENLEKWSNSLNGD